MKRIFVAVFSIVLLAGFESGERIFAPGIDPWPRWEVHDPASEARIDHGAWQDFLETYVTVVDGGADLLAYDAVTPQDRADSGCGTCSPAAGWWGRDFPLELLRLARSSGSSDGIAEKSALV
jgi:hypothetical protein